MTHPEQPSVPTQETQRIEAETGVETPTGMLDAEASVRRTQVTSGIGRVANVCSMPFFGDTNRSSSIFDILDGVHGVTGLLPYHMAHYHPQQYLPNDASFRLTEPLGRVSTRARIWEPTVPADHYEI